MLPKNVRLGTSCTPPYLLMIGDARVELMGPPENDDVKNRMLLLNGWMVSWLRSLLCSLASLSSVKSYEE